MTHQAYGETVMVGDNVRVTVLVRVAVRVADGMDGYTSIRFRVGDFARVGVFEGIRVGDFARVGVFEGIGSLDAVAVVVNKNETAVAATANGSERFVPSRLSPIMEYPRLIQLSWPS